jgi:uncharacterized protein YgbK (DUF1537 family)
VTNLRLLADDLTGALDTAAELTGITGPVPVFWHGAIPSVLPPNAALDSGTRELDLEAAVRRVTELTARLTPAEIAFKKVDSLMRGPTLAEAAACFRTGTWTHAILAPAFPYQGRITRNGVQHARDAAGNWAPVGGDIVERLRAHGVPAQVGSELAPGITVFDAETDEDLLRVAALGKAAPAPVLWIGTGGLAQAIAAGSPGERRLPLQQPVLGLFGSDQAVTAGQLAACGPDWLRLSHGGPAASTAVAIQLETRGRALVSVDLPDGLTRADAAERIAVQLHGLAQDLPAPGTLIVAGGETLRGLCVALGATSLEVQGRIVPGLPCSVMRGGRWDGVAVLSKSGAFGTPNLLRDLLRSTQPVTERTP